MFHMSRPRTCSAYGMPWLSTKQDTTFGPSFFVRMPIIRIWSSDGFLVVIRTSEEDWIVMDLPTQRSSGWRPRQKPLGYLFVQYICSHLQRILSTLSRDGVALFG